MIEICLPVYKRHNRLPKLFKDLAKQTNKKFYLNVWNNKPDKWVDSRSLGTKRISSTELRKKYD